MCPFDAVVSVLWCVCVCIKADQEKETATKERAGLFGTFSKFIVVALCFCRAAVVSSGWAGACVRGRTGVRGC